MKIFTRKTPTRSPLATSIQKAQANALTAVHTKAAGQALLVDAAAQMDDVADKLLELADEQSLAAAVAQSNAMELEAVADSLHLDSRDVAGEFAYISKLA